MSREIHRPICQLQMKWRFQIGCLVYSALSSKRAIPARSGVQIRERLVVRSDGFEKWKSDTCREAQFARAARRSPPKLMRGSELIFQVRFFASPLRSQSVGIRLQFSNCFRFVSSAGRSDGRLYSQVRARLEKTMR